MTEMKVGIFGCGRIGKFHIENLVKEDLKIKTVVDFNQDLVNDLQSWAKKIDVKLTTDENEIWNDPEINAIMIFASTNYHIPLILKAAEKVKYIFCEKPVSMDLKESLAALNKLKNQDLQIQLGFNRRFDNSFALVEKNIAEKKIGKVHLLHVTSRDPEPPGIEYVKISGGIFMDMAIHDFDMARFLSHSEVEEVYVMGGCLINPEIEKAGDIDSAVINLKFANKTFGIIDISRQAVYGYDQRIEVFGSEGVVKANNQIVNTVMLQTKKGEHRDNPPYFFIQRYLNAYVNEYKAFIEAFKNNKKVPVSLEDGVKAQLIAVACQESLKSGKPIQVQTI